MLHSLMYRGFLLLFSVMEIGSESSNGSVETVGRSVRGVNNNAFSTLPFVCMTFWATPCDIPCKLGADRISTVVTSCA